jgi:hypothetical protein
VISTERWRAVADLDSRSGAPVGNVLREAADVVDRIRQRIDRAFAEDADKWEADKHSALEDIEKIIDEGK